MSIALARKCMLIAAIVSLAAVAGCEEEEFFRSCPLSATIIEACEIESTSTTLTCVVAQHPICDEQICAKWEGSESFCSRTCLADTDCPSGSSCLTYLDFAFCVPEFATMPQTVNR